MSVLNIAAQRILCIALVLAPLLGANVASAQDDSAYGNHQSPINIIDTHSHPVRTNPKVPRFEDTSELQFPRDFVLKNTTLSPWCPTTQTCTGFADNRWGSLKAYPDPTSSAPEILFGNASYHLLEFHFHTPAEHLVNSQLTEMEVHFVFTNDSAASGGQLCSSGGLLVIGQRITKGEANPELDKIFGPDVTLPTSYKSAPTPIQNFTISNVLGGLKESYRYAGSLTAPFYIATCDNPPGNPIQQLESGFLPENVSWVLLQRTIQMSEEQIARFQALFHNGDARGPQPLKEQKVTKTPR
jgi:carbonic anhydrase